MLDIKSPHLHIGVDFNVRATSPQKWNYSWNHVRLYCTSIFNCTTQLFFICLRVTLFLYCALSLLNSISNIILIVTAHHNIRYQSLHLHIGIDFNVRMRSPQKEVIHGIILGSSVQAYSIIRYNYFTFVCKWPFFFNSVLSSLISISNVILIVSIHRDILYWGR